MTEIGTATAGEKELKTDYPNESGLTAGTETQKDRKASLEAEGFLGRKTTIPKDEKKGM